MSPPSKTQGRLPESLSLSIGLHALLLLIPLGAFIHSEGEVQGRTRIELVDVAGSTPLRDPSADLQTQREAEADLLAKNATGASPPPPADSDNEGSSLDPKPNPSPDNSAAIPPPGSSETSDGEQKISPEDEASRKTRESDAQERVLQEAPPRASDDVVLAEQADTTVEEEPLPSPPQTTPVSTALLRPPETVDSTDSIPPEESPAPDAEEEKSEEEERDKEQEEEPEKTEEPIVPREFARAPSRGPEMDPPPNTTRISDQNMRVEEELRAAVHSTEEGSAELGVSGSTASSGRPAPPGSQPAGRRGQSGEAEKEGDASSPEAHSAAVPAPSADGQNNPNSLGPSEARNEDPRTSHSSQSRSHQMGSFRSIDATPSSAGQDGYRVPQAPDGDIAALLAARRGSQLSGGVESRSQAGAPYRPSLALPGLQPDGAPKPTGASNGAQDSDTSRPAAAGDGLAEAGEYDGLHPEVSQYRRGAPSGGASVASPGAADRSATAPLTVADLSVRLGDVTRLNARATPLGVYISTIEDEIRKAWVLPVEYRAMGTQGVAEVSFVVSRNGRVSRAKIVRKSGTDGLDRIALQSIPRWLPRFPNEIDRRQIQFSYVFRATDSIVTDVPSAE